MKPDRFDYDKYLNLCHMNNEKAKRFINNDFLPVGQWTLGEEAFASKCRDRKQSLELQLDGMTKTLEVHNDWIPYLEPWHGVGVYAQAFGCPFEWSDKDAPWTRTIISDIEGLRSIEKPDLYKSEMLMYVMETVEYFEKQTKGEIAISVTDTQSPLSTLSLICDVTWMLTEAWDYPEDFHRALDYITDLIIEFTLEQRKICSRPAVPGHTMWSPEYMKGISLSDDLLALVGSEFYEEFGKPYSEKIAKALGGVCIHSCGNWSHSFDSVSGIKDVSMIDLAIDKVWDPNPNIPENIIKGFGGSNVPVQVRCNADDMESIEKLIKSKANIILSLWWDEDPFKRKKSYEYIKKVWEESRSKDTNS